MSWKETMSYEEELGYELPIETLMECDYCGKTIEWYSVHRDYDNPTEEMIQTAKDTHGWISIGLYAYDGDEEHPDMVEIEACSLHVCPDCRENKLKIGLEGRQLIR